MIISPDLAARKILVAAFQYYVLDCPTMSDSEYDFLSCLVAKNWDALSSDQQWAFRRPGQRAVKRRSFQIFTEGSERRLPIRGHS